MTVVVLAFARIREIVGSASFPREVPHDATADDLWRGLALEFPALAALRDSTRLARGGAMIERTATLDEGDEIALLPPFGGG